MKPLVTASLICLVGLSACSPFRSGGESVVSASSVGQQSMVERCRVLDVREITIRDDNANGAGTVVGTVAGGIIGNAAGREVGAGVGNELARGLGSLAGAALGAAAGEAFDQDNAQRQGLEYSVILADGRETIVIQEYFEGDRIAQPGSTCRIETNLATNAARILPGENLPGTVAAPERTRVAY
ncbi:outer membrane lipoprotein SlyB [Rubricella aquisinus]|uniref:Outer membrane lipoprotein SlyB n=1 Tax=Rubricella aquisinus TaxID=2028108 RepID=A0A840WHT3_9RHOB|nr:hypothetical protein [Rubricella aquisinus]MBB5514679.1 outer membrane lipoprotein SlyB [Rubricella aquisinus]